MYIMCVCLFSALSSWVGALQISIIIIIIIVSMLVCVYVCVRARVCVCVLCVRTCVYALRIVSTDKILRFIDT